MMSLTVKSRFPECGFLGEPVYFIFLNSMLCSLSGDLLISKCWEGRYTVFSLGGVWHDNLVLSVGFQNTFSALGMTCYNA